MVYHRRNIFKTLSLIITLSLGLLSLTSAQAGWLNDQNNCKVWNDEPAQARQTAHWTGQCNNGYATGRGTIKFNSKQVESCSGQMTKGKLNGQVSCKLPNNSRFSGHVKNGQLHGQGVLRLNQNCPTCIRQFSGKFYKNNMAQGTLSLVNGKKAQLKYYPDQKGCLVWNQDPSPRERISWSGSCKGGYGHGKGVLKYSLNGVTESFTGTLKAGKLEGYGVLRSQGKTICAQCVKTVSGTFKNHILQKGKATLGNGQVKTYNAQQKANGNIATEMVLQAHILQQMRANNNLVLYGSHYPTMFQKAYPY